MKTKLAHALIGAFLAALFGTQAVANSQIKEDFAYAFGSSAGLDSGSIRLLSPSEMDETEGLFIAWLMRMAPRIYRGTINVFDILATEFRQIRRDGREHNAWLRIHDSTSHTGKFNARTIAWGSTRYNRNRKIKNLVLRGFNKRLRGLKIPLNTWRTNDPGHLHLWKIEKRPPTPGTGASGTSFRSAAVNSENYDSTPANHDAGMVVTPPRHDGSGGTISGIDWETITAEDLLSGKYTEELLTDAATGPTGTGRTARDWKMEDLTEKQVALGLAILLFVSDPENNADLYIPWEALREYFSATIYLGKNPRKNARAAKLAKLGLKQLEYIIGQHSQDYHPSEDDSDDDASAHATGSDAGGLPVALTTGSPPTPGPVLVRNTYLPIQAHWWMHDFEAR